MRIEMLADRKVIKADGKDISYITITLLDEEEAIIRNKDLVTNFYVSGDAYIVGFENDTQSISDKCKTVNGNLNTGTASLILQAGNTPQIIAVTTIAGVLLESVKIKLINADKKHLV